MAIDITDRRRIAESLRSSEQRFRTLASHAPVGIFQTGPTGETVFVNESWCAMSGLAAERALGRGWLQAVHPDDRKRVDADWEKAVRSGVASEAEFRFMKSDGQVTWLQGNAVPLRNLDGALAGYIGTVVDITARKTAEIALRESEQRFRHMADHAPVMIWVTDGDGSCTFLGKTWYEFTGRTPETSLGFGWVDAVHPDDRAIARDSFLVANAAQRGVSLGDRRGAPAFRRGRALPGLHRIGHRYHRTEIGRRGPAHQRAAVPGHWRIDRLWRVDLRPARTLHLCE
jgi:PAS domain S-box-containing protein